MAIRKPRGTQDFLPEQMIHWHYIEQRMREICKVYGFNEIRTPAFEETKLFLRGIGETTDVVQKEMYTFTTGDDGGSSFTLRPENTASAVRAYLENKVYGKEGLMKERQIFQVFGGGSALRQAYQRAIERGVHGYEECSLPA